jgi:hypothetical protein
MNKKEQGKALEDYVALNLQEILGDKTVRATKNSGGSTEIGDVRNNKFYIECKNHDKKDITFSLEVWNKLCAQIPMGQTKTPIYMFRHLKSGENFALLKLEDFFRILKGDY